MPGAESTPRESDVLAILDEELNYLPENTGRRLCSANWKVGRVRSPRSSRTGEEIRKKFSAGGRLLSPIEAETLDKIVTTAVKRLVVDVLTEAQEKMWRELLGEPFSMKRTPLGVKIE